jgi:hypothetical protein
MASPNSILSAAQESALTHALCFGNVVGTFGWQPASRDRPARSYLRTSIPGGGVMFRVGQKVVCIIHEWNEMFGADGEPIPPAHQPQIDGVYIVSEVEFRFAREWVVLVGFHPLDRWDARWFRPLTDISVFTAMLNNVPLHDKEHA